MATNVYINNASTPLLDDSDLMEINAQINSTDAKVDRLLPVSLTFKKTFEIYMHQGLASNTKHIPSNTLPAFLEALKAGFNGMETDCRKTSDGVWVLSHDASITGTVGGVTTTMAIDTSTLAQLKTVLLGTSADYGDTYIATLQEVLQVAAYTGMKMLLEYKGGSNPEGIAEVVMQTGTQGRVTYMCSHNYWAQIAAVDKHASFAEVFFSLGSVTDFSPYTSFLTGSNTVSLDYKADASSPNMENVRNAQKAGLSIDYWNISQNNHETMFDTNPRHITVNGTDVFAYLATYLAGKEAQLPIGN